MSRIMQKRNTGFGTIPNVKNFSNPSKQYAHKNLSKIGYYEHELNKNSNQDGEGFYDVLKSTYEKGKELTGKVLDFADSDVGVALRNLIPPSDESARPGFKGERHAILELPNGKQGIGNFMGPGTKLKERLLRGDPPRTYVDKVAKMHDINYTLAANEPTKAKQLEKIRKADERMIKTLQKNKSKDTSRNINLGLQMIKAKKFGEDAGLLSKSKFASELKKLTPEEKEMIIENKTTLEQEGFGLTLSGHGKMKDIPKPLPGEKLRAKLLKSKLSKPKTSANLLSSKAGSGLSISGSGLNIPGRGKKDMQIMEISSELATVKLPKIIDALGLKIPVSTIKDIVDTAMKSKGTLPNKIKLLTHQLLPILSASKVMKLKKMKGSGLKLAGQLSGQGMNDIMAVVPKTLTTKLNKAIKAFFNKKMGINKKMSGSGETFWEGFKRGFLMVFKPGAKILGGVATALGFPEIGLPLEAVSEIL